jgi:peptide/nickel transport system permease protein
VDIVRFSARRLLVSIPVLVLASLFVFILAINAGNPLAYLIFTHTPHSVVVAREHQLHIGQAFFPRYWFWISHFLRGNFGTNNEGIPVNHLIWTHLWVTVRLVSLAMVLAVVLSIIFGVISAVRQYSTLDYTTTFVGFLLLSMPVFWFAALLKEYLAIRVNHLVGHTFIYTIGDSTPGLKGGFIHNAGNYAGHLLLPTVALAGISYAAWSRYERATMLDVLSADYIRMARAKGLPPAKVLIKHALRNALIPLATVVAIDVSAVLGATIITEQVFDWQGMGSLLFDAVTKPDVNELLAWLMVSAVIVVVFNLIADVLYGVLDPRIRV